MKSNGTANGAANGAAIRAIREAQGRSLRQMALGIGSDRGTLSKIETGQKGASTATLAKIAAWLDVPVDAISRPAPVLIQVTPDNLRQITEMLGASAAAAAS